MNYETAEKNYVKSLCKGLLKVLSKMGISTIRSYRGAKLFEAIGLSEDLVETYFGSISSKVGGIGLAEIARDAVQMHKAGYKEDLSEVLEHKGIYSYRKDGEKHAWNPETISTLQLATRLGSYKKFKEYTKTRRKNLFSYGISWTSSVSLRFLWKKLSLLRRSWSDL